MFNTRAVHNLMPKKTIDKVDGKLRQIPFMVLALAVFFLPTPSLPFGSQELYEFWQDKYVVPGTDGVLLDVHYLQTEESIVEEMFKLLDLRSGDVLYDLGCGDGIIVIRAVQKTGIHGVGIDLDPRRIAESKANAIAAQVADKTTFLQQDLFQSDIKDATVVTLFLLDALNLKLRPKLFRELRPGTRIVSHNFHMGDWKPDKKVSLGLRKDGFHNLFYWVLPANISGLWQGRYKEESWSISIKQRFQRIEGSLMVNGKDTLQLSNATITGDVIRFATKSNEPGRSLTFEGKVVGNTIEGNFKGAVLTGGPWKAARNPATISRIY